MSVSWNIGFNWCRENVSLSYVVFRKCLFVFTFYRVQNLKSLCLRQNFVFFPTVFYPSVVVNECKLLISQKRASHYARHFAQMKKKNSVELKVIPCRSLFWRSCRCRSYSTAQMELAIRSKSMAFAKITNSFLTPCRWFREPRNAAVEWLPPQNLRGSTGTAWGCFSLSTLTTWPVCPVGGSFLCGTPSEIVSVLGVLVLPAHFPFSCHSRLPSCSFLHSLLSFTYLGVSNSYLLHAPGYRIFPFLRMTL